MPFNDTEAEHAIAPVTVVGAGPAGIIAGLELAAALGPGAVRVIDPAYAVGGLSACPRVPGNTATGDYRKSLAPILKAHGAPSFAIDGLPATETCSIGTLTEPLAWMSNVLLERTTSHRGLVEHLTHREELRAWELEVRRPDDSRQYLYSEAVLLATGGRPKALDNLEVSEETRAKLVPLLQALDPETVQAQFQPDDSVAIVGSSHSGVLALMNILRLRPDERPRHVTMFYRSPIRYARKTTTGTGETYYDNTGLKGLTAEWAHNNLESDEASGQIAFAGEPPEGVKVDFVQVADDEHVAMELEHSDATKIVDARGLLPSEKPYISNPAEAHMHRVSIAELATYGAVDRQKAPGLFCFGTLAPHIVSELTDGRPLLAGNVGVTKFRNDSPRVVEQIIAFLRENSGSTSATVSR